jgi:rhodanese-related sulfurtransferase
MKRPSLTLNQKLAALALALGVGALFAQPHRGPVVRLDTRELAMIVEQEVDHVTPAELAAWIVEGRSDYRLLDLRNEQDYAAYHIPTAENVPVAQLPEFPLLPTEKVVLYSEGGIHAAQAWMLMRAQGHEAVYTVLGGLDGWKDEVVFPVMPAEATAEQRARFERSAALAKFFGGQARVASEATPASGAAPMTPAALPDAPELPSLAPPAGGRAAPATAPKKKKKEGC